jgi:hypothetical protein
MEFIFIKQKDIHFDELQLQIVLEPSRAGVAQSL